MIYLGFSKEKHVRDCTLYLLRQSPQAFRNGCNYWDDPVGAVLKVRLRIHRSGTFQMAAEVFLVSVK